MRSLAKRLSLLLLVLLAIPVGVDVPVGKGHVVLFANNPIWRGETIGSCFMVFNTILNFDNLNAGRTLDPK